MRVTFCAFDAEGYVGGPNSWLQRLLPLLRDGGLDPQVLCVTPSMGGGNMVRALRSAGIEVVTLPWPAPLRRTVRAILQQLSVTPPDVFVPNMLVAGFIAGRVVRAAGIPTVGVLHSDDRFHRAVFRSFVRGPAPYRLSALVCVSEFLASRVAGKVGPETVVRRIPCGTPLPDSTAQPPETVLRMVYVGRLVNEQKRIVETVRALCRAVESVRGTEAVIYGTGPDRDLVQAVIASEGCGLPVRLAGVVGADAVLDRLLESHVFVLLSEYEGLPIALMEAMACGVVPVCLKIDSGVHELVQHEVHGLLVGDRSDEFVAAVRRLRDDVTLWQQLSTAARAKASQEYSASGAAELWLELLKEIAAGGGPGRRIRIPLWPRLPPYEDAFAREDFRWRPRPLRWLGLGRRNGKTVVHDTW